MNSSDESSFSGVARTLDRPTYENLKRALEVGRWPDGRALTDAQSALCLETVITWEAEHLPAEARSGFVESGACADRPDGDGDDDAPRPLRIIGGP